MPKLRRRGTRLVARELEASGRRRARDRAALKRKLRLGLLAIFVAALSGGLALGGPPSLSSPPVAAWM